MNKKNLLAAASALLVVILVMAMTEEEETMLAMQLSKESGQMEQLSSALSPQDDDLALAMRLSEESAKKEEEAILKPGTHKQFVDIPALAQPSKESAQAPYTKSMIFTTKLFKVYQIAVQNRQENENVSCGPRVVFFAHAIDALHKKHIPIASKTINDELSPTKTPLYSKRIEECRAQIYSDQIEGFIKENQLNIAHYYVIDRNVTREGLYYMVPSIPPIQPAEMTQRLSLLGKDLLENKIQTPIHFFFVDSAKAHWVLISVIKGPETKPVIYYIDPKNIDLDKYVVAHQFIAYVVDNLGLKPE